MWMGEGLNFGFVLKYLFFRFFHAFVPGKCPNLRHSFGIFYPEIIPVFYFKWFCSITSTCPSLTFSARLYGACGSNLVAVVVPLPTHILQRNLAHEDGILVFLNVQILQILHDLQLMFCVVSKDIQIRWFMSWEDLLATRWSSSIIWDWALH